ncbi:MAG: YitT family protein, partial [Ezakiella coagulans]
PKDVSSFLILLGRSATIYEATGAYTMEKRTIVQTVVTNRDFIKLKNHLKDLDKNAFMIVSSAHQVFGFHWKSFDD